MNRTTDDKSPKAPARVPALHHICVCVCTFARPKLLARLLVKLNSQETDNLFTYSAVIIDNDASESARSTVQSAIKASKFPIVYDVEPERSISLARNRSISKAEGALVAFIDDDEFPDDRWLVRHYRLLLASGADGVLGPVLPHFDGDCPGWLVNSGLLARSRLKNGEVIRDSRHTRTGNVLIWRRVFDDKDGQFDPKYGRSGGGDAVFFRRMMGKGKVFVWSDEGCVFESVPSERQKRSYYIRRAMTRGMTEAWSAPFLSKGTAKSALAVILYTPALPFLLLFGQHVFMRYLVKDCDHLAKLLAYLRVTLVSNRPYQQAGID